MPQRSPLSRLGAFFARTGTIVVVAFLVRLALLYALRARGPYPISEVMSYGYETGRIAQALAAGQGFSSPLHVPTGPTAWMTPLFPLLLSWIFRLTGIFSWTSYLVIGFVDCAFSALTVWPIKACARKAFGDGTATTAAWAWVFLPTAVHYAVDWVWDTALVTLLFALVLLATLYLRDATRAAAWAGYGALLGITALANASVVSTFPFLLGWAAVQIRAQSRSWARLAATAVAAFVLVMSPWWIRNYSVFHRFIPFRSNLGLELWLGNNSHNPDIVSGWLHPDEDQTEMGAMARLGELAYMDAKQKEALAWIRSHPADFLRNSFDRVCDTWIAFDEPMWQIMLLPGWLIGLNMMSVLFAVLTFSGALLAARRHNPFAVPLAIVILAFPLVYYVTHSSMRYRQPIEPEMTVLSSYALAALVTALRPRRAESDSGFAARPPAGEPALAGRPCAPRMEERP